MTTQTPHYVATTPCETRTLKARYDEALALKEAWDHRVEVADLRLRQARAAGEGVDAARRNVEAVAVQHEEAVTYMGMCLDAVDSARHRAAVLAVRAGKARGGVITYAGHR